MIDRGTGNLIEADVEALVNTVNTVGIMGRGVALQFRQAYPGNYEAYRSACDKGEVEIGRMFVFETHQLQNPKLIINFPTKRHWKEKSQLSHIQHGLLDLVAVLEHYNMKSVAIPPLGCGLGGLSWTDVKPLIVNALEPLTDVRVHLYEPAEERVIARTPSTSKTPNMTPARAALLTLMGRYMAALMDIGISLLEIHKLMYFMQEAGEPLRLQFEAAHYGPFASNLRHVLIALDGHYISGYGDGQDKPNRTIELVADALDQAEAYLAINAESKARVERVGELIEGFETPIGMELLATVLWVARNGAKNQQEAVQAVRAWNLRKSNFRPEHIAAAWQALDRNGWLPVRQMA